MRLFLTLLAAALLVAAQPHDAAAQEKAGGRASPKAAVGVVNINTAPVGDLEALPGIGAKTAARIVEYRQKNGPFKKVEEILETSRSCPYSLSVFDLGSLLSVSGSR